MSNSSLSEGYSEGSLKCSPKKGSLKVNEKELINSCDEEICESKIESLLSLKEKMIKDEEKEKMCCSVVKESKEDEGLCGLEVSSKIEVAKNVNKCENKANRSIEDVQGVLPELRKSMSTVKGEVRKTSRNKITRVHKVTNKNSKDDLQLSQSTLVQLFETVYKSGCPNFRGCRMPDPTSMQ